MAVRLEDIKNGASVRGVASAQAVHVISVDWIGDQAISVVYRDHNGSVAEAVLYRDDEHRLEVEQSGRAWSFDADGALLRLVTEANRIKLAHYFDPYLAIHTSLVDPLPHQISAVYGEMLPRQPLRFLLADDPGAGKTIMAGLLMKELIARSDLERCLVVAPGSLVEQWQDELGQKFNLEFDILSRDMIENSRSGNPFSDRDRLIVRLDVLARNEELQEKLMSAREWDLIICDEAHRMSATYFGGEVKYTRRYQVGQKLGQVCRHLLLMSATPHNGKEEDFQLFMALLDGDRFEGRFRDGVHYADTEDMMRRLTKEELLKFDGRPLFPERRARTVKYQLSEGEAALYTAVTEYVRTEMNRVQRFAEGDGKKRNNVGFALQILQRRLASSPAAIYQSLKRRRERLENELGEARLAAKGRRAGTSEPTINADNRIAADKAAQIEAALVDVTIDAELGKYVNGLADRGHFDAVQVAPASSAEVPDEAGGVRAVVLGVKYPHNGRDGSDALVEAKDILTQRGSTPRVYRNMLVFIAAEARQLDHLRDAVRASLAWGEIVRDKERLELRPSDQKLAEAKQAEARETMKTRLKEAWCYLHYPAQESAQADWEWVSGKIPAQDGLLARASKKLVAEEGLLMELGPSRLDRDLQKYIWNDKPRLSLKDLREYLNRYIYLPRLKGQDVLVKAVHAAISGILPGPFAYAERWDEKTDTYAGLAIERAGNTPVVIDSDSVIIKPDVADAHRPAPVQTDAGGTLGGAGGTLPTPGEPVIGGGALHSQRERARRRNPRLSRPASRRPRTPSRDPAAGGRTR